MLYILIVKITFVRPETTRKMGKLVYKLHLSKSNFFLKYTLSFLIADFFFIVGGISLWSIIIIEKELCLTQMYK